MLRVAFDACWNSRIWSQGFYSNYESSNSLPSESSNLAFLAIRRQILSHAFRIDGTHDVHCTARQRYVEYHNSAGSATAGASPGGDTTSSVTTQVVPLTGFVYGCVVKQEYGIGVPKRVDDIDAGVGVTLAVIEDGAASCGIGE